MGDKKTLQLSFTEKLHLAAVLLRLPFTFLTALVSARIRGPDGAASADRHVQNAITRALTAPLSVAQLQYLLRDTTTGTIVQWKQKHPEEDMSSEEVGAGAKVHWIGSKSAKKVLFFIHGVRIPLLLITTFALIRPQEEDTSYHSQQTTSSLSLLFAKTLSAQLT
jgi:hypothetical protein